MLAYIRLIEAREADACVEYKGRSEVIEMIERAAVVDAIQEIACRNDAIDHARPVAAILTAPVVRIAEKEALFIAEHLIESVRLGMECVEARLRAHEVV